MYSIFACITQDHHYGLLLVAVAICVVGATLTAALLRRFVNVRGRRMWFLWALSSLMGGATMWSTHFIAMLAYDPGVDHSHDFNLTFGSLLLAIGGVLVSSGILRNTRLRFRAEIGGALLGLTVSSMHYLGMAAYQIQGELFWLPERVLWSISVGGVLGALAYKQVLRPAARIGWFGGAFGLALTITAMHFTGMTAFTILLNSAIEVPPDAIPDGILGMTVSGVTAVLFLVGFTSYCIEIDLESEARGQLRFAAMHDQLTALPNRLLLAQTMERISKKLANDDRLRVAVLSIDLNLFKQINDTHGHSAGDAVLVQVAKRLTAVLSDTEFLARMGGDEFVVIRTGFDQKTAIVDLAHRLHNAITMPIDLDAVQVGLGASIGISNTDDDGRDLDVLLRNSDQAMYFAKLHPDLDIFEYNAEIDRTNKARDRLATDLRNAVGNGEFELV